MNIRSWVLISLVFISNCCLGAEAQDTFLFLFSNPGDLIGEGKIYFYTEKNGNFVLKTNDNFNFVNFLFFPFEENAIGWCGLFTPNRGHKLKEQIPYLKAKKNNGHNHPGLNIFSTHSCCRFLYGKFRILELARGEGETLKFAADFIQKCEGKNRPLLFGGIRYGSTAPLYASVADLFGRFNQPDSLIFTKKKDVSNGAIIYDCKTDKEARFEYFYLKDDPSQLLVKITHGDETVEVFDLSFKRGEVDGFYYRLPHQAISIDPSDPWNEPIFSDLANFFHALWVDPYLCPAKFKIIEFSLNSYGEIEELALNFQIFEEENWEGAIRYRSRKSINLLSPAN